MKVIDVPIDQIYEATWNPNVMDAVMHSRLLRSVERFGLVVPLRPSAGPSAWPCSGHWT
jgi:hypothetical protein